jgi:diacylglycerol O-acyltransferase
VPVAVKEQRGASHDESVNRLSGMLVPLATTTDDPLDRLTAVRAGAAQAKQQEREIGGALFGTVAELMVPLLAGAPTRALSVAAPAVGWPPFNVVVSSFPGSTVPLYCGGSRLVAYYPLGPVVDGAPLNVTVTTYGDEVCFGILACEDRLPAVDVLAERVQDAARELVKAAVAA